MAQKSRLTQFVFAAVVTLSINGDLLAAWGARKAPANQMCPMGSYVIGFDSEANIVCSEACGNGVLNPGEACDDGNTESGDACPATCKFEGVEAVDADGEAIVADPGNSATAADPVISTPIISDVKPSKLVYGTRELKITVIGTGFFTGTVIEFDGATYSPSVNQAGTELNVTIPTRNLIIGPYAITVSNGTGMNTTLKKALEVY